MPEPARAPAGMAAGEAEGPPKDRPESPPQDGRSAAGRGGAEETLPKRGIVLLVALTILWGLNWPMMKLALQEIPPWTFRTLCLLVGGSALLALSWLSRAPLAIPQGKLPPLALASVFNITGWHLFSAYALLHTGSGRASIVGYTMPIWATLLSVLWLNARLTLHQVTALGLGTIALALLLGEELYALGTAPLGTLLMLGAAICWAIGTVLIKRVAWAPMSVTALTGWQQLIGLAPILIGWWILEPWPALHQLSLAAALGLAYAVFVAMIFCHTAYFKLVSWLPAHVAAISVLAVPVVGVVSSALLLGEQVGPAEVVALVLVVSGLFLLVRASAR